MRSSTSARNGRFLALSIQGDAPFTAEMLDRRDDPGVAVHHYAAPEGCAIDDEAAWHAANPGIAIGIKSIDYMRHEAKRVPGNTPADQASFRAFDLNQPQSPSRVMLCDPSDWAACEVDELPPRTGACTVSYDLGGSASMTAACALFGNGRLEVWAAFPDNPDLKARAESDGCRGLYQEME